MYKKNKQTVARVVSFVGIMLRRRKKWVVFLFLVMRVHHTFYVVPRENHIFFASHKDCKDIFCSEEIIELCCK